MAPCPWGWWWPLCPRCVPGGGSGLVFPWAVVAAVSLCPRRRRWPRVPHVPMSPPEDVEADVALQVDVGVIDHGLALHLGGVVGVALAHLRGGGDRWLSPGATSHPALAAPAPMSICGGFQASLGGHRSLGGGHRSLDPTPNSQLLTTSWWPPAPTLSHGVATWATDRSHRGGHQPPVPVPTHTAAAHVLVATCRAPVATSLQPPPPGQWPPPWRPQAPVATGTVSVAPGGEQVAAGGGVGGPGGD